MLLDEQARQESQLIKVSTMLHDLIKVNLQKEIPADNTTEHLPDLQSQQYLYPTESTGVLQTDKNILAVKELEVNSDKHG